MGLYCHAFGVTTKREQQIKRPYMRLILAFLLFGVAACSQALVVPLGPDGKPLPRLYRITPEMESTVYYSMLDGINAIRARAGLGFVSASRELNAAAATHARDMALQNRPWHFGSDGSSPLERLNRVGYTGGLVGEAISETYETENETLAAWLSDPASRGILLNADATEVGFSWFQEKRGKIWWMLVLGKS